MAASWLALPLFWLPLLVGVPLGVMLALGRGGAVVRRGGLGLLVLAIVMIAITPWTLGADEPESAAAHVGLGVLGPSLLMAGGSLLATFGGSAPVGRLPPWSRGVGFVVTAVGIAWFLYLAFVSPPALAEAHDALWATYVLSLLFTVAALGGVAVVFTLIMGAGRGREAIFIGTVAGGSLASLLIMIASGAGGFDAARVRNELWGATADLLGWLIGLTLAIVWYAILVYRIERSLPEPPRARPFDATEKARITADIEQAEAETAEAADLARAEVAS